MSIAASKASNVLLAKCRAKFGGRLTGQDITALMSCRTVQEAAAYLKSSTRYAAVLETTDPLAMYRINVESAVRRMMYDDFSSLCRYELSVGEWFSDYIIMSGEILQIISFLCLLAADRPEEFISTLPGFFMQHADFDYAKLGQCHTYEEFLEVMRTSRFGRVLRAFTPLEGEAFDCAAIEHALYRHMYAIITDTVKKHYSGDAKEELLDLIGTQLDMRNICYVYRMKKYYGAEPDLVRALLFSEETRISSRLLGDIINAPDAETALKLFSERSANGRKLAAALEHSASIEIAAREIVFTKAVHLLRFSIHPSSVLLAYIIFAETEVQDITSIVEAVYYNMPSDEIKRLITIDSLTKQK